MELREYKSYAEIFHDEQERKGGEPYIGHVERVSKNVESLRAKKIAYIHDVLEDTEFTSLDLIYFGMENDVIDGAIILTKRSDETYFEYIQRILDSNDEDAIAVKVQDTLDNYATVHHLKGEDWMRKRYKKNIKIFKERGLL